MPKSSKSRFPKTVYVRWETDRNSEDEGYLIVNETPDGAKDGERVAVYELREFKTKSVTHSLR